MVMQSTIHIAEAKMWKGKILKELSKFYNLQSTLQKQNCGREFLFIEMTFICKKEFLFMEGLLQKQLSFRINVRGRFMAHVLCEVLYIYAFLQVIWVCYRICGLTR